MITNRYSFLILYLLAFIQGMVFSTIPAAANFLAKTLSTSEYGLLFISMMFGAIISSLLSGSLGSRYTIKFILLAGCLFNTLSMALFAFSTSFWPLIFVMLFMGFGFGSLATILNLYVIYFFPKHKSTALIIMFACAGFGTAMGPIAFNAFSWPEEPIRLAGGFLFLLLASIVYLPTYKQIETKKFVIPNNFIFWLFPVVACLYGFIETSFTNWMTLFLHKQKGLTEVEANNSLSIFWMVITGGRIVVALIAFICSPNILIRFLALLLFISPFVIRLISDVESAFIAFGIAGLGCSAFLPLLISLAEQSFIKHAIFISGILIASYTLGLALASFDFLIPLYDGLFIPLFFLGILSFYITKKNKGFT